jgi:hypothetical protein
VGRSFLLRLAVEVSRATCGHLVVGRGDQVAEAAVSWLDKHEGHVRAPGARSGHGNDDDGSAGAFAPV